MFFIWDDFIDTLGGERGRESGWCVVMAFGNAGKEVLPQIKCIITQLWDCGCGLIAVLFHKQL